MSATSIPSRVSLLSMQGIIAHCEGSGLCRVRGYKKDWWVLRWIYYLVCGNPDLSLVAMAFRGVHNRNPELHISVPEAPKADGVVT